MATPLFRSAALRDLERRAAAGLPAGTLMQRAGEAAAAWIVRRFPQAHRIVLLCGPGNNGGDGYVCATALRAAGREVACIALGAPSTDDAQGAAARWRATGGPTHDRFSPELRCDLGIDAMFGIGLARPLSGIWLDAARWLSALPGGCVALDVPSGLDADTGAWVGDAPGVHATATVSFLGGKPGLFTGDGVDACGAVVLDALGIDLPGTDAALNAPGEFADVARPRLRNTHKGRFGNVVVTGGAAGMVGAALLAARAALRLGAGRVYVDAIDGSLDVDQQMPELMFRRADSLDEPFVTVIGCGLGDGAPARERLAQALQRTQPCVLDADALNLLAADRSLRSRHDASASAASRVLTPHPREAGRLLGVEASQVQSDRVEAAREIARRFGATVVLKGAGSIVATPDRYWINPTGGPALASAGTGDVLAGMIGALLAQGFAPTSAVLAAVWLHGSAADRFGADIGLTAGDIALLAARDLARLRRA